MALVYYKGKLVSPMELKMIREQEEREKKKKEPIGKYDPKTKKPIEKPVEKEIPPYMDPSLKLDFEDYPYPTEKTPSPKFITDIQTKWFQYESMMEQPSEYLRAKAYEKYEKAREAKLKGEDVRAGILFSEYMLTRAGAGAWTGLTLPFRPLALVTSITQLSKLLTSHKGIPEAIEYLKTDPGVVSEIAGGALGGAMLSDITRFIGGKYQAYKTSKFLEKYPEEKFFVPEEKIYDYPQAIEVERKVPLGIREVTTTAPDEGPVATLWPKGKWPKWWGGTAVERLRETPEYVKQWVPIWKTEVELAHIPSIPSGYTPLRTVLGQSYVPALLGGMGAALKIRQPTIEEQIKETRAEPIKILKPVSRKEPKQPEPQLPGYVIRPIEEGKRETITLPMYLPRPVGIIKTVDEPIQEIRTKQRQIIFPATPSIPSMMRLEPKTEVSIIRPESKKKRDRMLIDLLTVGEFREYEVKPPSKMLKELFK